MHNSNDLDTIADDAVNDAIGEAHNTALPDIAFNTAI
jgi:hypothetical protein